MTNTTIVPNNVSFRLPDGKTLFENLNGQFDLCHTGLVGRNGVGKTALARVLSGTLQPSSGSCLRTGRVHYLRQPVALPPETSVADLLGVRRILAALERIEAGSSAAADFEVVGDSWDIRRLITLELDRNNLGHLRPEAPAGQLSGGEVMRIAVTGAMLSGADFLILDEPSNHLDGSNRDALIRQLRRWAGGLVVVSHDRQLLESMDRIVELSSQQLHCFGGNFADYLRARELARQNALDELDRVKHERQRSERCLRIQRERQARRQARVNAQAKVANQAKVLLSRRKESSEISAGALKQRHMDIKTEFNARVRETAMQVESDVPIVLHDIPAPTDQKSCLVNLDRVALPFVEGRTRVIDSLALRGRQRLAVVGPNGCGKSTLVRVLAGQLSPISGTCKVTAERAYLSQNLETLDQGKTVLEQLLVSPGLSEGELRMRLAQLGLDERKVCIPSGLLSGGERVKAALACALYADSQPRLLLLDEPDNHLDLPSLEALEAMLCGYQGALVVVSHDERFLNNLALTDRLLATEQGWRTTN